MIVDMVRGDIFETDCKHIAFAVNTDNYNDAGFAGQVAQIWPDVDSHNWKPLGRTRSHCVNGTTYHAMVCHTLRHNGWDDTPEVIKSCLLKLPADETIAMVLVGGGMIGSRAGADTYAILGSVARSDRKIIIYTL